MEIANSFRYLFLTPGRWAESGHHGATWVDEGACAIMLSMAAFIWTTRVRYVDTDASGRIHYTSIFRYFEAAEQEFLRTLGRRYTGLSEEEGWPRVHAECDISSALTCDDEIAVEVLVSRVGNSSIELSFRVLKDRVECGKGRVVIVCMDRATQRSKPLPVVFADALRKVLDPDNQLR